MSRESTGATYGDGSGQDGYEADDDAGEFTVRSPLLPPPSAPAGCLR